MTDFALALKDGDFDIVLRDLDIAAHDGLETAILMSLLTDARAQDDDQIINDDRRGWWGDYLENQSIGSRLWLLRRAKITDKTVQKVQEYVFEALKWLLDDGGARKVETNAARVGYDRIDIEIKVFAPNGAVHKFDHIWRAQIGLVT